VIQGKREAGNSVTGFRQRNAEPNAGRAEKPEFRSETPRAAAE